MTTRTFRATLLAGTAVFALTGAAGAQINRIGIDSSSVGSTHSLAITQDDANLANIVAGATGTTSLAIVGPWDTVSINQQGGANTFRSESLKAASGSTTASLSASYGGGKNTHTLNIGATTPPANPALNISVTNNGAVLNTVTDTLNGNTLTYGLTVLGTGNSLTNSVSATGGITLGQTITGDTNTVGNTVSGVASFSQTLGVTGDSNIVANTASGGGAKTINQTIGGSSHAVTVGLTGTGTQSSDLTIAGTGTVDFIHDSAAADSATTVSLTNVIGGTVSTPLPGKVYVTQTASADGATANLTVGGGAFYMGVLPGSLPGGPVDPLNNPGVYAYQNSSGAVLNAVVTAAANGYTAKFLQ